MKSRITRMLSSNARVSDVYFSKKKNKRKKENKRKERRKARRIERSSNINSLVPKKDKKIERD